MYRQYAIVWRRYQQSLDFLLKASGLKPISDNEWCYRIFICLLIVFQFALTYVWINEEYIAISQGLKVPFVIFSDVALLCTIISALYSNICILLIKKQIFQKLYLMIYELNMNLDIYSNERMAYSPTKLIIFIVGFRILLFANHGMFIYTNYNTLSFVFMILMYIVNSTVNTFCVQYSNVVYHFGWAISDANKKFANILPKIQMVNNPHNNIKAARNILFFRKLYEDIFDIIKMINDAYGSQCSTNIASSIIRIMVVWFLLMSGYLSGYRFRLRFMIPVMMEIFHLWISIFVLTLPCKQVMDKLNDSKSICYRIMLNLGPTSRSFDVMYKKSILMALAEQLTAARPVFTAANVFTIDYTLLYSIIGFSAAYLIVLIQYSSKLV